MGERRRSERVRDDAEGRNVTVEVEGRAESEMGILSTWGRCNGAFHVVPMDPS